MEIYYFNLRWSPYDCNQKEIEKDFGKFLKNPKEILFYVFAKDGRINPDFPLFKIDFYLKD